MTPPCSICDYDFKDGDKLVAVMLSTFVAVESGVTFAITEPTKCVEIIHRECYDFPNGYVTDDLPPIGGEQLS